MKLSFVSNCAHLETPGFEFIDLNVLSLCDLDLLIFTLNNYGTLTF